MRGIRLLRQRPIIVPKKTALVPFTAPGVLKNVVPPDRVGGRSLEDFYDNSVLQELVNEGFLTKDAKQKK
jgi:hypothetical protein